MNLVVCQFTEWFIFLLLWQASVLILRVGSVIFICNKKGNAKKNQVNQNYDDTAGIKCTINQCLFCHKIGQMENICYGNQLTEHPFSMYTKFP